MNKFIKVVAVAVIATFIGGCGMAEAANNDANQNSELLAIHMIAKFEGFRSYVYTCPGGKKTIGYGFTEPSLIAKGTMTVKEADRELGKKVRAEIAWVRKQLPGVKLTPKQEAAIVSSVYNLGHTRFLKSQYYRKLKQADFKGASKELAEFRLAQGKVVKGLVRRRAAECAWLA